MLAGVAEFGERNLDEATAECMRAYGEEMGRLTVLTMRALEEDGRR